MRLTPTDRWRHGGVECFLLEPNHATADYVGWLQDPDVNRFLESRFAAHSVESVRAFIDRALADSKTLFLGIRSLQLDRHVGNIKIDEIDRRHGLGEIGIMIGDRAAWGQGVGSDAIRCMTAIAVHELGLRKITAGCYASNLGSARAFEKAGFHIEGRRPRHFILDGRPEDLVLMARYAEDVQ